MRLAQFIDGSVDSGASRALGLPAFGSPLQSQTLFAILPDRSNACGDLLDGGIIWPDSLATLEIVQWARE